MNGGRIGQKKTALTQSFGKPQNCINETTRDFELPMPSMESPDRGQGKACSMSKSELCPKVENVEFTNLNESMRNIVNVFKELIVNSYFSIEAANNPFISSSFKSNPFSEKFI